MSKRIIAMLLALTLVAACLPVGVVAEEAPAQHTCEHCQQVPEWTEWDGTAALEDGKHYKLTAEELTLSAPIVLTAGTYVLCLNGNTISGETAGRIFDLSGTASLIIVDHTAEGEGESYTAGKLTDATNSAVAVSGKASFTMYDGIMENNKRPTGKDGGCIFLQGEGTVQLKGGLYRNNFARYGAVVYMVGNRASKLRVRLQLENAYITGNTSTHTGAIHGDGLSTILIKDTVITGNSTTGSLTGGMYVTSAEGEVTLTGKVIIDGNSNKTADSINRNMILNNAAAKLNLDGITQGSRIQLKTASTDPKVAITTTENQKSWNCGWITLGNDSASWTDANADGIVQASELAAGHYHNGVKYMAVTGNTTLSTTAGNYYLTQDVKLAGVAPFDKSVKLCLNGHNITTKTGRIIQTTRNSGAELVIEDCSAYTDAEGTYHAGAITGANFTSSGAVYVNAGTTLKLYGGKISENVASAAAGVYNAGTFYMYGGEISNNHATNATSGCHGGGVYNAGAFFMEGGTICNNEAKNYGGGVFSNKAATITGGTISGNSAAQGGGVGLYNNNTFVIGAVTITGNTGTTEGGGLWLSNKANATLTDTVITDNKSPSGAGVAVRESQATMKSGKINSNICSGTGGGVFVNGNGAVFTLEDGEISGNTAKFGGGAMTQTKGSKLTVKGGTISKNTSSAQGGGVYISTDTNFYMEGGIISENTAGRNGGGVYNLASTSHISGGTIGNNISKENGGGIALNDASTLNLSGGTITGNTAVMAGGIHTTEVSVLNISGNPQVIGNAVGGKASNLYLEGDALLMNVSTMTDGAKVSVSGVPYRAISAPVATDCSGAFASDSSLYAVKHQSGALYLDVAVDHNHCVCGGASANGCDHAQVKFAPLESNTTLPSAGAYYLMDDVTLTGVKAIDGDLTLCLHGHNITVEAGKRILQLTKDSGATLTIVDCKAHTDDKGVYQAGAITGADFASSGTVYVNAGTTLKLYGGKISGNTANAGAGVYCAGTFYMYGGELSGNKATAGTSTRFGGGAMINGENAAFHMQGGTICTNQAGQYGGGVFVTGSAKATFTKGTITGNSAAQGGGVGLYKNTFELGAVTISGNTATTEGGGLWASSSANVTLNGTVITGNTATENGGGGAAVRDKAKVKLVSAEITKNTAKDTMGGGLLAIGEGSEIIIEGGKISENTAKFGGGVLIQTNAKLTLKGGSVEKNTTTAQGGGVYVSSGTNLYMEGGTITGNTAKRLGGGVYNLASTSHITGGTIENNTSEEGGGGMATTAGTLILEGAVVRNNQTPKNGGGIYLVNSTKKVEGQTVSEPAKAQLLKKTLITGNHADKGTGGGIFVSGEGTEAVIDGATISKNTAKYGAGVITQTKSSITLKSGKITENDSTSNGGGAYISTNTTLNMEGGEISKNKSGLNGGGIYFLNSNLNMTGGKVSANTAKTDGGGMYLQLSNSVFKGGSVTGNSAKNAGGIRMTGGKHRISGLTVSYNTAETDGGGIQIGRQLVKENGVNVDKMPDFVMYSGTFIGNKAKNGGALLLLSKGAQYTIHNAYIAENEATNGGGGIYVSTGTTLNMYGGTITGNYGKTGGGIMMLLASGNYENVEISDNTGNNAPAVMINKPSEYGDIRMKNVKILNNVGTASGAVVVQGEKATLYMEDSQFKGNSTEKTGGAIFTTTKAESYIKNTTFEDNSAGADAGAVMLGLNSVCELDGCTLSGNNAAANGGGIYNRGLMYVKNTKVLNNTCGNNGAGIGSGKTGSTHTGTKCGLYIENVISSGNKAEGNGGGLFGSLGCHVVATDLTLTDNEAKGNGGGAWVQEDFIATNLTATGNTASIGAVYLAASHYDGQSYFAGVMKFTGKVTVKDNQGGGVFVGERTTLTLAGDSLEEGSYMDVTLHSGLLTQKVFGVYDYEGGDLEYVVTPGERSVTDPEHLMQSGEANATGSSDAVTDALLYVGVGVFVVAIAAVIAVLVMKKKKAGTPARTKE